MAYFIEYVTHDVVGRSTIDSGNFYDALTKAEQALKGSPGIKAVLRYAPGSSPAFGEGVVLAAFTWAEGWQMHEPDPTTGAACLNNRCSKTRTARCPVSTPWTASKAASN